MAVLMLDRKSVYQSVSRICATNLHGGIGGFSIVHLFSMDFTTTFATTNYFTTTINTNKLTLKSKPNTHITHKKNTILFK